MQLAAQIGEGQHANRFLLTNEIWTRRDEPFDFGADRVNQIDLHGPRDILDRWLADRPRRQLDALTNPFQHRCRDGNSPHGRVRHRARRDIDPIADDLILALFDVTKVYACPQLDSFQRRLPLVVRGKFGLNLKCCLHGGDRAIEYQQKPVAGRVDLSPPYSAATPRTSARCRLSRRAPRASSACMMRYTRRCP